MLLYHLDRSHSLREGMKINLKQIHQEFSDIGSSPFTNLFIDGLSSFGCNILECKCPMIPVFSNVNGKPTFINTDDLFQIKGHVDSKLIEIIFEMVRKLYFSHYPSRFQSLFAVESVEEFFKWPELLQGPVNAFSLNNYDVYEISTSNNTPFFDSNWLRGGVSAGFDSGCFYYGIKIDGLYDFAYHYWNREFTKEPRMEYLVKLPIKIGKKVVLC